MPAPRSLVTNIGTVFAGPVSAEAPDPKGRFDVLARDPGMKALSERLQDQGLKPMTTRRDAYFGPTKAYSGAFDKAQREAM